MTTHRLSVDTAYVEPLLSGIKTFEVRANDRGYQVGDYLLMQETGEPGEGLHWAHSSPCSRCRRARYVRARITYVFSGDPRWEQLRPGVVVLALDAVGESLPMGSER